MSAIEKKLGWYVHESIGQVIVNPRAIDVRYRYVRDAIEEAARYKIVDISKFRELVAKCFEYLPNDKKYVFDMMRKRLPEMNAEIDKLEVLL